MAQPNATRTPLALLLPALGRLSAAERIFVARLISTGDRLDATKIAYPRCRTMKDIQTRAAKVLARKSIRHILAQHFGQSDSEIMLADVRHLLKRALRRNADKDKLVIALNRLAAVLEKYVAKEKSNG